MYGLAVDDWSGVIAVPHVSGDGQLILTSLNSLPTLPAARIYRLTAVLFPGMENENILGVFEATGRTGTTLTGVTASAGYPDINLSAGTTVQIRVCRATIKELQDSLDTINSNFNSQVVHVTGNETVAGTKTFTSPIIGTITGMALDNTVVHVTGNETVAGVKTFTGKSVLTSHVAPITVDSDSSVIILDCSLTDWHEITLGGNRTLALANDSVGQPITVVLVQDNTGSRTAQWWSGIRWNNGITPTLTVTPNKIDVFTFKKMSSGFYLGFNPGKNQ